MRVRAIPLDCNSACVCSERVCAPRRCARPPIAQRRLAVFIARPAPCVTAARVVAFGAIGRARARFAAGVTWTCRTASAPWAARSDHTSVVDAAGAIYVIGGRVGNGIYYNDVWASTDGGARPDSVGWGGRGGTRGGTGGTLGGTNGGTKGTNGVLTWYLRRARLSATRFFPVLKRRLRGTQRVLGGARARYRRGTNAVPTLYRRGADAVPTWRRRGADAVPTRYLRSSHGVSGGYSGYSRGTRGYRGCAGSSPGVPGVRACASMCLRVQ